MGEEVEPWSSGIGDDGDISKREGVEECIVWEYGRGEEGIKEKVKNQQKINAVMVESVFPWWFSPAISVDITVSRIWLTAYQLVDSNIAKVIKEWCKGTIVEIGPAPSKGFLKEMRRSNILLVGGRIPDELVRNGLWTSSIAMVLSTVCGRNNCPHPWLSAHTRIRHSSLGGVTDGNLVLACDHQINLAGASTFPVPVNRLRKDLRWVLKGRGKGSMVSPLLDEKDSVASSKVSYLTDGEIIQSSLWPLSNPNVLVHTVYRQDWWVKRPLSWYEKLLTILEGN